MLRQQLLNFLGGPGLDRPNNDVFPSRATAKTFLKHRRGLPDAGGVSEENLEPPAATLPLFPLNLLQKLVRCRTTVRHLHILHSAVPGVLNTDKLQKGC